MFAYYHIHLFDHYFINSRTAWHGEIQRNDESWPGKIYKWIGKAVTELCWNKGKLLFRILSKFNLELQNQVLPDLKANKIIFMKKKNIMGVTVQGRPTMLCCIRIEVKHNILGLNRCNNLFSFADKAWAVRKGNLNWRSEAEWRIRRRRCFVIVYFVFMFFILSADA